MAYDLELAKRIRKVVKDTKGIEEKKMFGGIGFLLNGNMVCGIHKESLIVRIGPGNYEKTLNKNHVEPFDITGRTRKGWVMVRPHGIKEDKDLKDWVKQGLE